MTSTSAATAPALAPATVGVLGSGADAHRDLAVPLGELLAQLGVNLLTGGGGGVMESVAQTYCAADRSRGISIGIIPCASLSDRASPRAGYPNRHVELAIRTHLPSSGAEGEHDLSRNHLIVLSATVLLALPGGAGTASELALAQRYRRAAAIFSPAPEPVAHFPPGVPRLGALAEVRAFLLSQLALAANGG